MNPMSQAIKNRRMDGAKPPMAEGAPQAAAPEQQGAPLEQIVASLGPDDKSKLMEMLAKDMAGEEHTEGEPSSEGMEDEQGSLLQSPAEQSELSQEQGQQFMADIGDHPEGAPANGIMDKVRVNAKKLFGKGK